jgi:peptidoglycan/LPS O-acetylase OafA/YrhL
MKVNNPVKKARIEFLDYLRGIAILAVLATHSFPTTLGWRLGSSLSNLEISKNIIVVNGFLFDFFDFAVPLFIFISGFVLSYNYPANSFNSLKLIRHRLFSVLPGYVIFSLAAIIGLGVFNGFPTISTIIFKLLTASASDPLWYIAVIIQLYLFYPLIIRIYDYFEKKNRVIIFIGICILLRLVWRYFIPYFNTAFDKDLLFSTRVFIPQLIFFVGGIYASRNYGKIIGSITKNIISLAAIFGLCITFLLQVDFTYPAKILSDVLYITFCLMMFTLSIKLSIHLSRKKHFLSKSINLLGTYSFGIYLIHPIIIYGLCYLFILVNLSFNNWIVYLLLFVLTTIFTYLFTFVISFLPLSRYIIGVHNSLKL